jgi:tetratricopeptide (TPR) repeat protein
LEGPDHDRQGGHDPREDRRGRRELRFGRKRRETFQPTARTGDLAETRKLAAAKAEKAPNSRLGEKVGNMSKLGMSSRGLVVVATLLGTLASAYPALAVTPEERAAAREQLSQAQAFKKEGNLAEALSHFQEAARLDPKLSTSMDLADCAEKLGKLLEAQTYWAAARDQAKREEKPQSRAKAEERLAAVEQRIPHLTVQLAADAPAGTSVLRNDLPLDAASLGVAQALNPGDYVVVVKAPEHEDATFSIKLSESENQILPVAVGAAKAPPPPPPRKVVAPPPVKVEPAPSSWSGRRTLGMVLGAGGLVGIGAGAPLWFVGYRDSNSLGPTAGQQLLAGQILVVSGGALLVTGAVLFLSAPSERPQQARVRVAPTLAMTPHATFLGAAGEF